MEAFPFTEAEWAPAKDAAVKILDAQLAGDDVLVASLRIVMLDLLADLRARHGDHPVLLETVADYAEGDDTGRAALYRRAVDLAAANGLPTLSTRQSFATLLSKMGQPAAALEELRACGSEAADGDGDERAQWASQLNDVAGYADGDAGRAALYRRAMEIAAGHAQPTLSIRLSLVRFLLDVGESAAAREELRACRSEVAGADEDERAWWAELSAEVGRAGPRAAPDPAT